MEDIGVLVMLFNFEDPEMYDFISSLGSFLVYASIGFTIGYVGVKVAIFVSSFFS